ncbi:Transposon Tf2-9 polyprotein [Chionoecetes opilio]|uniref:Transposon Tf2-9 polyprotein n=1 Tax=Chionoecetes opilio TaxID=41210 RepID=A0A8J4YIX9_CHIOP|nr:Transposon Tf2-9 polyprotein [Chionoecetes opilio]
MWQYLADYGGTPQHRPGQRRRIPAGSSSSSAHDTKSLCYTTPYHPQGNSVTERMHRTLKSVLSTLCQGHPLRWPTLLQPCQITMNQAVHTSTGKAKPHFAFFSRHAPRLVGTSLPGVEGEQDDMDVAHALIRETHQKMSRRYRDVANRKRKNQVVEVGALVWVRKETTIPGTCRKLNVKWHGIYRMMEVRLSGSVYVLKNVFTGKEVQRAAEQVKPYHGSEEWLVEPVESVLQPDPVDEQLAPRVRRPPRRLIEED